MPEAFEAEFITMKPLETRPVVKVILEIPNHTFAQALQVLGGLKEPGESRWVGVALLKKPDGQ